MFRRPEFGSKTIVGKSILVTRSSHQAVALSEELRRFGFDPVEMPLLSFAAPESWQQFDQAFLNLRKYDWLLFASANAIEKSLERAETLGVLSELKEVSIACMGSAGSELLERHGIKVSFLPDEFVAESFAAKFPRASGANNKLLWSRGDKGRQFLKDELENLGYLVDVVISYRSCGPENPDSYAELLGSLLKHKKLSAITLTSSQAAQNLKVILQLAGRIYFCQEAEFLAQVKLAVIGPETAKTCIGLFGRVDIVASEYTVCGLANALNNSFNAGGSAQAE